MQYGPRIAAFVIYLLHYQWLAEKRLAELMADLFGVSRSLLSTAKKQGWTMLQTLNTKPHGLIAELQAG